MVILLEEVKRTLEIEGEQLDGQLNDFIGRITDRLLLRLGEEFIPPELEFVVIETTVKRFNLKGNEGMSSYWQEGERITYEDLFHEYADDINLWIVNRDRKANDMLGKLRFL